MNYRDISLLDRERIAVRGRWRSRWLGRPAPVDRDGKRVYELTEAGRTDAEARIAAGGDDPWGREGRGRPQAVQLFDAMKGVALAAKQVVMAGNPAQIESATEIVKDARKRLYQLLAAD